MDGGEPHAEDTIRIRLSEGMMFDASRWPPTMGPNERADSVSPAIVWCREDGVDVNQPPKSCPTVRALAA